MDEPLSETFTASFKDVQEADRKIYVPASPASVCVWLEKRFSKEFPEHTTIHAHKSDSCSECEQILADINSVNESPQIHRQHQGDVSVARGIDISELEDDKKHLEQSHSVHLEDVDHAMKEYKAEILHAPEAYSEMTTLFENVVVRGRAPVIFEGVELPINLLKLLRL